MKHTLTLTVYMLFLGLFLIGGINQIKSQGTSNQPNVLFIAVDDLNDWTGYLGGHPQARTPNIDRLAESGIAFTQAYPSSPVCGPSRAALLYGRYPHISGAYGTDAFYSPHTLWQFARSTVVPEVFRTNKSLPAVFGENGYYTAGAGKVSHFTQYPRFSKKIVSFFTSDFDTYHNIYGGDVRQDPDNPESDSRRLPFGPAAPGDERKMKDVRNADWAIQQLNSDHKKPFFIALGIKKPHLPWVAPQSYFDRFDLENIQLPEVPEADLKDVPHAGKIMAQSLFFFEPHYSESDHQAITKYPMLWKRLVRAYLAASSYADAMVGKVLDALEGSPYADNTIVVLWGDNGWHLGEKKSWRKMTLWEPANRIPFIIRLPNNPANGQTVDHPVSLQDLYPTLVELTGLNINQPLDGNSLVPLLDSPDRAWDKPVLTSLGPGNFAIRSGPWRYIRYQNGNQELYNLKEDPQEFNNLANENAAYQRIIKRLARYVPVDFVKLYNHRSLQFANLDTMRIFIE